MVSYGRNISPVIKCRVEKSAVKIFLFGYRKWNILAFRGRLMSLLAPARGMSTLPAKGGFSRPSFFTHCGVSSRPFLPQDKVSFFEIHRTPKKWLSFSSSLAYHARILKVCPYLYMVKFKILSRFLLSAGG